MVVYGLESPQARKLSTTLLARAVREHWGLIELPEIARGPHGKPYFPGLEQYQFNLSHSGNYVVCALGRTPVGIDIQIPTARREYFLDRICSGQQRAWLRSRNDSPEAVALLWSMKESLCKYDGRGLTRPINVIDVPLPEAGERRKEQNGLNFYLRESQNWQLCLCTQERWDGEILWI